MEVNGEIINPVMLVIAIKGKMENKDVSRGGECFTKGRTLKEMQKIIWDEFIGIFLKTYSGAMAGIKIKKMEEIIWAAT